MQIEKKITVIMPIGGIGQRFKIVDKKIEKPLIKIKKIPLFLIALYSLRNVKNIKEIIIISRKKILFEIKKECKKRTFFKNKVFKFVCLSKKTKSPLHTVLKSKDKLNFTHRIICIDNDLYFKSREYLKKINTKNIDSVVPYFRSRKPIYSYINTSKDRIINIKEKKVISSKAVAGAYFFKDPKEFLNNCEIAIKNKKKFISDVIMIYLRNDKKVYCGKIDYYKSFGTPEELKKSMINFNV